MPKLIAAFAVLLLAAPALAQTRPLTQGGAVSPGDVAKFQGNGQASTAGTVLGDDNGRGVNPFSIYDRGNKGLCFRPTSGSGAAHVEFCLGHTADGSPLISVQSMGGASAKTLKCSNNGVIGNCFGSGGGGGGGEILVNNSGGMLLNASGSILLN